MVKFQVVSKMFNKLKKIKKNRGMTYVELIVVLSIFAVMSGVVLFNYKEFQAKVEIKRYANDIALRVVEAQKSAMAGRQGVNTFTVRPSYGVRLDKTSANNKQIIYFADYDGSKDFDNAACGGQGSTTECIDKIIITRGNYIKGVKVHDIYAGVTSYDILDVTFTRPNAQAVFKSGSQISNVDYAEIEVASPLSGVTSAYIKIYSSGRVQIN